jgi:hypothetical protein
MEIGDATLWKNNLQLCGKSSCKKHFANHGYHYRRVLPVSYAYNIHGEGGARQPVKVDFS